MKQVRLSFPDGDGEHSEWRLFPLGKVVRGCLEECGKEMTRWCWGDFGEPLESDCFSLLLNLLRHGYEWTEEATDE